MKDFRIGVYHFSQSLSRATALSGFSQVSCNAWKRAKLLESDAARHLNTCIVGQICSPVSHPCEMTGQAGKVEEFAVIIRCSFLPWTEFEDHGVVLQGCQ
jgi:hypothetical protein